MVKTKLSTQEMEIIKYMNNNFDIAINSNIEDIAALCHTSTATVSRACKKSGFEGFTEFKFKLKNEYSINRSLKTIEKMYDYLDVTDLGKMRNFIVNNKNCVTYGYGASNLTSEYLSRQFLFLDIYCIHNGDDSILKFINPEFVLLISNSGENNRVISLATEFKSRGIQVFSITKKDSTLAKISNLGLFHSIEIDYQNQIDREQQIYIYILINILVKDLCNELQ